MKPIITLEYMGDATDNIRDARKTLAALRRTNPRIYEQLLKEGVFSTLDVLITTVVTIRGAAHAELYSIA